MARLLTPDSELEGLSYWAEDDETMVLQRSADREGSKSLSVPAYLPVLERMAKRMTAALWWNSPDQRPGAPKRQGGTVCLVQTGSRLLGITAAHIHVPVAGFLDSDPKVSCQLGAHSFDPRSHLIDMGEELDLAVYHVSEIEANAADTDVHVPRKWRPEIGMNDPYLVGGWPWDLRSDRDGETGLWFLHFIARLSDSDQKKFVVGIDRPTSVAWRTHALPAGTNIGGMSGGPVIRIKESGLWEATLVGVIYGLIHEAVIARPLHFIDSGGRILRDTA